MRLITIKQLLGYSRDRIIILRRLTITTVLLDSRQIVVSLAINNYIIGLFHFLLLGPFTGKLVTCTQLPSRHLR